jgi:hypothetical protein
VVPIVGVLPWQYAVHVMAVDVRGGTVVALVADLQAVEAEPLGHCVCTYQVMWTTPSGDSCRWAVERT